MKKIITLGLLAVVGIGIYYTGIYTYFIENKVAEEMPEIKTDASASPAISPGTASTPSAQIKILKQGSFVDADFIHKGSGQAKILEYPDGRKILRFENFETINGPDLYVYLAESSSPTGDFKSLGNFIDLGQLKGNIGDQNYELPRNTDTSAYTSAIIWCKKFGVLFPYAILK